MVTVESPNMDPDQEVAHKGHEHVQEPDVVAEPAAHGFEQLKGKLRTHTHKVPAAGDQQAHDAVDGDGFAAAVEAPA